MTLAEWMTQARKTPADVAGAIGVHPEAVRKWLRGERIPRAPQMASLVLLSGGKVQPGAFYEARQ